MSQQPLSLPRLNAVSRQAEGLRFWLAPSQGWRPIEMVRQEALRVGSSMVAPGVVPEIGAAFWYGGGSDKYDIYTDDNATWLNGLTGFSVAAWIRTPASIGQNMVVAKHSANTAGTFYLSFLNASKLRFAVINSSSARVDHDITYSFAASTAYHVVGVYNGTDIRLYINGVAIGSPTAQTGGLKTAAYPLHVGNYSGVGYNGDGWIGDARVYTRALTAEDVQHLYNPQTRWELYAAVPLILLPAAAPPVGGPGGAFMHYQRLRRT